MEPTPTIVEYTAEHEGYRCGYCKSSNSNFSHGMWTHQLTVQDYQDLIDRGWRRSGKYCYKPTMKRTCCPQFTIKCNTKEFQLNKSHKKQIKLVNRFLITGVKPGEGGRESRQEDDEEMPNLKGDAKSADIDLSERQKPSSDAVPVVKAHSSKLPVQTSSKESISKINPSVGGESDNKTNPDGSSTQLKHEPKSGIGADKDRPPSRKKKQIRLERKLSKQSTNPESFVKDNEKKNEPKTLEDFLNEPDHAQNCAHKLEIQLCRSSPESHHFRVTFHQSYSVYRSYQMKVHNDQPEECDKHGFQDFLVTSPLEEEHKEDGPPQGYGSFHQHYLLDGKIIAVGVIDILPSSVSSVYLYYDPEYSFLGLGVYSALREIAFVRELSKRTPALHNYYMGFYIHSCLKMRYKGQYIQSYLSCPESYAWVPIEQCRPKLDASRYARLSEEGAEDKDKDVDINQVLVLCKGTVMPYAIYKMMNKGKGKDEEEVKEYASLVGKTCAERMYLVRK